IKRQSTNTSAKFAKSKTNRITLALFRIFSNRYRKVITPHEIKRNPILVINQTAIALKNKDISFICKLIWTIMVGMKVNRKKIVKGAIIFGDSFKLVKNDFGFHKKLIKVKSNPLFFILYCTRPLKKMIFVSLYHM